MRDQQLVDQVDRLTGTERLRSLAAGLIGAALALLAWGLVAGLNELLQDQQVGTLTLSLLIPEKRFGLISAGIIGISGFLFGVTYRYATALRPQDAQLQAGVVLAFGLVRGLAVVEPWAIALPWSQVPDLVLNLDQPEMMTWLIHLGAIAVSLVENLIPFAIAGLVLSRLGKSLLATSNQNDSA